MTGPGMRALKWLLPIAVSVGAFWFLLGRIDLVEVIRDVDARAAAILIPSVLVFGAVSLWLEAVSIDHLAATDSRRLGRWTCARIKAATYPLGLLNYALGAGGLTYLLRRRGGLAVSEAAGIVMLIALFDLGLLLVLSALGVTLLSTRAVALQAGVVTAGVAGIAAGFVFLRTSVSLGPLERIRGLELFRAARETPVDRLVILGLLRLAFVISFILVCGAALMAFGVRVPPGDLAVGVTAVSLVASLPIAVAGLGTGQVAFVYMFRDWAAPEILLASNLALTAMLILMRSGMGLLFAREFTREALEAAREIGELGELGS
ncbi:MAG TPA: hypothetical protein ENI85_18495 [Deltaproteobacteria bacterium]|nr:hypothetical protein [Deltaproteobacteria bacterium]